MSGCPISGSAPAFSNRLTITFPLQENSHILAEVHILTAAVHTCAHVPCYTTHVLTQTRIVRESPLDPVASLQRFGLVEVAASALKYSPGSQLLDQLKTTLSARNKWVAWTSKFFWFFLAICFVGHDSFFWGHWYHCFGLLVTFALGFKARVDSLACVLPCLRTTSKLL